MKSTIRILALATLLSAVFVYSANADTINIPADFSTIQEGIDASTNGDTVLVQPGTYVENINYNGKNITVGSLFLQTQDTYYISHTIIDGDSLDCVVRFQNGEDSTAILKGFTIQNGNDHSGGGIFCWNNSSPSLERLVISGNNATSKGGGVLCYWNSSPNLNHVEITENYSYDEGGGICCGNDSSPRINNVTISGNITSGFGGGISCNNNSSVSLENLTISGNSSVDGGGIYCDNSSPSLDNVTISGNNASDLGGGIYCCDDSSPSLENVTISDNSASDLGGGIYCCDDSSPSLENVSISNNSSEYGGGMYCNDSSPSLVNVAIFCNSASDRGGGLYLYRGSSANLENVTISGNICSDGGGIYFMSSNMSLKNVTISGNSVSDDGGGMYCSNSSPSLENVTISGNSAGCYGGGIYCNYNSSPSFSATNRCNIYSNTIENIRGVGFDIYSYNSDIIDVIVDTFSVLTPTDYYASPINNFAFDILHSIEDSLVNADVYVSVDGDDSNAGISPDEPFKTIRYALSKIYSDSLNINTIHLAQGVYSDSTNGEMFPLNWSDYVNLSGSNQEYTILDARNVSGVMKFNYIDHAIIENITITNGNAESGGGIYCNNSSPNLKNLIITNNYAYYNGGGIYCEYNSSPCLEDLTISGNSALRYGGGMSCSVDSSPSLENVTISGNSAGWLGGGIYCFDSSPSMENVTISNNGATDSFAQGGGIFCRSSSPSLVNVTISGNIAVTYGGGIYFNNSSPILQNVTILNNYATGGSYAQGEGGGIYCYYSSPSLENVTISENSAGTLGGGIYCNDGSSLSFNTTNRCNIFSNTIENMRGCGVDIYSQNSDIIDVIVDTFSVLTPTDYYASPINNFVFDILHSIEDSLVNADVYVSVDGDDSNAGTCPDEPFKTIRHALSKIYSDSLNINTIHLAQGVYSDSTNGEVFPINWNNYVNLSGSNHEYTILDARNMSGVMEFNNIDHAIIENITVTNGNAGYGGGMYCNISSPSLENVTISNNSATGSYVQGEGGGIYCNSSSPSLENVIISGNSANRYGGGMYCKENSSPSLVNVTISGNSASDDGGGLYLNRGSSPHLVNVVISNNSSSSSGGGVYCYYSSPSLQKVTVSGNYSYRGGGIYCNNSSSSLENLTISGNYASDKGGGIFCYNAYINVVNTIVSYNTGNYGIYASICNPSITYSDFYDNEYGNFYGCGQDVGVNVTTNANEDSCDIFYNIQLDPLFADTLSGDYQITWAHYPLSDSTKSPCIDAGDPSSPLDPDSTIADIGAFYFYHELSIEYPEESSEFNLTTYPNPINSSANCLTVRFIMRKHGNVTIQLFNIRGQLISTLVHEDKNIGEYTITYPVNELSPGIYFTKMSIDGVNKEIRKMVLLR